MKKLFCLFIQDEDVITRNGRWAFDVSIPNPIGIPDVSHDAEERLLPEIRRRQALQAEPSSDPPIRSDLKPFLELSDSPTYAFQLATSLRKKCVENGVLRDAPKKCLLTRKRLTRMIVEAMVGNFADPFVYDEKSGE